PTPFLRSLFFLRLRPPPRPTLFPYTTLFRSQCDGFASSFGKFGGRFLDGDARDRFAGASRRGSLRCFEWIGIRRCGRPRPRHDRSEEHTSELQSRGHLVCRLLLEKKNRK